MTLEDIGRRIVSDLGGNKKFYDIIHLYDSEYRIKYIEVIQKNTEPPRFNDSSIVRNLFVELRDMKILQLFDSKLESGFDVEDIIYTEEQKLKLKRLRSNFTKNSYYSFVEKLRNEYSKSFEVGQPVYYKNYPAIITFKHNENDESSLQRWSVLCNGVEYRRIYGTQLLARKVQDLSHIKIDEKLNKLSTEKLLKMYRRKMKINKGRSDLKIKRILNDRENIKKDIKIVN